MMSEYQCYAFLAVDRPLDQADRQALRALSTRARITATQFVNVYHWGDFRGDPAELMRRWFDLHLYVANWGTRRLMLRLPARLVDQAALAAFLDPVEGVTLRGAGDNLVLDILCADGDPEADAWGDDEEDDDGRENDAWGDGGQNDGIDRLAALAPLRSDLIDGDLRPLYLLWLRALEAGDLAEDAVEPLPGIGPLTPALRAFADFLRLDPDTVRAAAEREVTTAPSAGAVASAIAALADDEKNALLVRLFNADPHAGAELRRLLRRAHPVTAASTPPPRTAGTLRARAEALRRDRARATAAAAAEERRRAAAEAEAQRGLRLAALAKRGEAVWRNVEAGIERRHAAGYAEAAGLLSDLKALAATRGSTADFDRRLAAIRERHARKARLLDRLAAAGL